MPAGRPSAWEDRFVALAYGQALLGKTNPQIAEALGVSTSTLKAWMRDRPAFKTAIARGKAEADGHVAGALFQACVGFTKTVEVVKILGNGTIVRTTQEKYFPPDPRAQEVWLRNRVRELWANSDEPREQDVKDVARELRDHLRAMDQVDGLPELQQAMLPAPVELPPTAEFVDE